MSTESFFFNVDIGYVYVIVHAQTLWQINYWKSLLTDKPMCELSS